MLFRGTRVTYISSVQIEISLFSAPAFPSHLVSCDCHRHVHAPSITHATHLPRETHGFETKESVHYGIPLPLSLSPSPPPPCFSHLSLLLLKLMKGTASRARAHRSPWAGGFVETWHVPRRCCRAPGSLCPKSRGISCYSSASLPYRCKPRACPGRSPRPSSRPTRRSSPGWCGSSARGGRVCIPAQHPSHTGVRAVL